MAEEIRKRKETIKAREVVAQNQIMLSFFDQLFYSKALICWGIGILFYLLWNGTAGFISFFTSFMIYLRIAPGTVFHKERVIWRRAVVMADRLIDRFKSLVAGWYEEFMNT